MRCVVTAGPTFEPLDEVRRLTNFSTGRLGGELAGFLAARGHQVRLLLGAQATWPGPRRAEQVTSFTTTADLLSQFHTLAGQPADAIFHAAAVSDFGVGAVFERDADGRLRELKSPKISSRAGPLLAELKPTPKILPQLRDWFPRACLVGWKYEVDGDQEAALAAARRQLDESRTDACVVNGRAYGDGFGLVTADGHTHLADAGALYQALAEFAGACSTAKR